MAYSGGRVFLAALLAAVPTLTLAQPAVPRPEHPRPDRVRADWLTLNGPWSFEFDDEDRGLSDADGQERILARHEKVRYLTKQVGEVRLARFAVGLPLRLCANVVGSGVTKSTLQARKVKDQPELLIGKRTKNARILGVGSTRIRQTRWVLKQPVSNAFLVVFAPNEHERVDDGKSHLGVGIGQVKVAATWNQLCGSHLPSG